MNRKMKSKIKRTISILAGLLLTPFLFAQQSQTHPAQKLPGDVDSQELIAWSRFQKPHPTPQPLPPPDKGIPEPDQQTAQPANPQQPTQKTPTQTFTGKIVKAGDKYVLKVSSSTTYQLDEQSNLKQYEDQDVKIIGTLEAGHNIILIEKIELLS